jgi:hypothetical protein
MHEIKDKTVFISALDWGLGHATRCVPIIQNLLLNNNKVIIGVTPLTKIVFDEEFPKLEKIDVVAYQIKYSSFLPLWLKLLFDSPRLFWVIRTEKKQLEKIISNYQPDLIISDNRFGLYSSKVQCVFITHQLFLKAPIAGMIAQKINKKYILNFDEVWVPDHEETSESLSGALSHGKQFHRNVKFIGPQSRLQKILNEQKAYDYLFLVSGPEPQQSILKNCLVSKIKKYPRFKFALICSIPTDVFENNLDVFLLPNKTKLSELIAVSDRIICRSGYSTLMDMHQLEKSSLILVPTPGQTEQAYLAELWREKFNCKVVDQKNLKTLKF